MQSQAFEKLGVFYLGRHYDQATDAIGDEPLLYDAKDLTTHGICVGMTGSGKTGLCVSLIEEAALDGIPVIAIDPKGDLANLLLTFPELRPADFEPWIDPADAARKGRDRATHAAAVAELWTKGLREWGQDGARIARLRESAEFTLYTPGSASGRPLSVLRSLAAPGAETLADSDALGDRIAGAVSSLLALVGIEADPVRSREHVLLSTIIDQAWRAGHGLDLSALIRAVASPPVERVGVLDLESFYPAKERFELAQTLNALLASPGFAAWTQGEPLSVPELLFSGNGKPRVSVLSIAHLSDRERMFFVTLLLHEIVAWMRTQPGTGSLRALIYMDEVMGYAPPTANPPSKLPLLTLFKQARAFGVGVLLATQNPVDLDYKALSNAGTWFLGRLQTERDRERILDGLESANAGAGIDRAGLSALLSGLDSRVFVLKNVHDDQPSVFHVRWAMSYLAGPLTLAQIKKLHAETSGAAANPMATPATAVVPTPTAALAAMSSHSAPASGGARPVLPPGVEEIFLSPQRFVSPGAVLAYRPALFAQVRAHYVSAKDGLDLWQSPVLLAPLDDSEAADVFAEAIAYEPEALELGGDPLPGARFAPLPAAIGQASRQRTWSKQAKDHVYRDRVLVVLTCPALDVGAKPGESASAFRARVDLAQREKRDREVEALRARHAPKLARLQARVRTAEDKVERERSQYSQQKVQTTISVATTVLGALFGGRGLSRAATAARGASRTNAERNDVARAEESLEELREQLRDLENECEADVAALLASFAAPPEIVEKRVAARKADLAVDRLVLAWVPCIEAGGGCESLLDAPAPGTTSGA